MSEEMIEVVLQLNIHLSRTAKLNELSWEQMVKYLTTGELPPCPIKYQRCVATINTAILRLLMEPKSFKYDGDELTLRYDLEGEPSRFLDAIAVRQGHTLGEGQLKLHHTEVYQVLAK